MWDVVVAGAGPAGSVAALVLAGAGVRVLLLDRMRFPRHKLCGDTLNPGTIAHLRSLGLADRVQAQGLPLQGMIVTGPGGVRVEGRYPAGLQGRTLMRRDLDGRLLDAAIRAGAQFDEQVAVRRALVRAGCGAPTVDGLVVTPASGRPDVTLPARVVIAADGRRSSIAFGLGLARHPVRPRRWAVGTYFEGVVGMSRFGEMHIRHGEYVGVAPLAGGLTNACLVTSGARLRRGGGASARLAASIARDPVLRERFACARQVAEVTVLGPLAVESTPSAVAGLFLAGDATGFIDPMTGDGLRFAVRGGELAAEAALCVLARGEADAHAVLARWRREAFGPKWRFNRVLRRTVEAPLAVRVAAATASIAPAWLEAVVRYAGDCGEG